MLVAGTGRGRAARRAVGFAGALALPWIACGFALADPDAQGATGGKDAQRAAQEQQLKNVEETIKASVEQRRRIEAEIESVRADRARLTEALIETTAKVQESERQIVAANERLSALNGSAEALGASLEKRRGVIADVLAVLQRMGSHPPPAILVRPQDMSEAVRAATVLGSVIPELKSETEALAQDMDDLAKTRAGI
jgi:septal ring factor EnvC (AmiA/AmiB activator)